MRFMVLIPFDEEHVAVALCCDLLFWGSYSIMATFCQERNGGSFRQDRQDGEEEGRRQDDRMNQVDGIDGIGG